MELIRPSEVTAKIISLIEDSQKQLIIVSPYNNLLDWPKLVKQIKSAKKRGVEISYYARNYAEHKGLDLADISPILIDNLHAKLYINEEYAILSSMNLVKASDDHSVDFALKTQDRSEYEQVLTYFNTYIKPKSPIPDGVFEPAILKEVPVYRFFEKSCDLTSKFQLVKEYHTGTRFIKTLALVQGGQKASNMYYFSVSGFIERTISINDSSNAVSAISWQERISKYDLLVCLANLVSGLYRVPVADFYFDSELDEFTNGDRLGLITYIEQHTNLKLQKRDIWTADQLMEDINYKLHQRAKQSSSLTNER
jgi:hypothetical protein